ncbi:MAG: VOC family protein [Rhizobiales bacterium]|nr:VOC family protein [Hyphomicrobiales bacterium]
MISGLDHIVVLVRDLDAGVANYTTLFGREPSWRAQSNGSASAMFTLGNVSLELLSPAGDGAAGDSVRAALEKDGEGLASIAFAVSDIEAAHRRLARLGLQPDDVADGESRDTASGRAMAWKRFRASKETTHGVRLFFIQRNEPLHKSNEVAAPSAELLDSLVISTPDSDRAAALYSARLGIPMALDRTIEALGTRFIFLKGADFVIEIIHSLKQGKGDGPDKVWGLSWRVADIDAAHARLQKAELDLSVIREGRKPGTRVFTVKNRTCNVPTLLIQQGTSPDR